MNEQVNVNVVRCEGGYLVSTSEGLKIFTSLQKVIAEVKLQLSVTILSDMKEEAE